MEHDTLSAFQSSAHVALDHLKQEFAKLQTGRANAAVVEHIAVDAYGQRMELKAVATISVQDARSMLIQPWDRSILAAVEKAIMQANVGVTPSNDGIAVRLNFPPMTEERRVQMTKIVKQLAEQTKIKIRQQRQTANDALKQLADENERERSQKELQKFVDDANVKVESMAKQKEQEVMTV